MITHSQSYGREVNKMKDLGKEGLSSSGTFWFSLKVEMDCHWENQGLYH